jgi:hypothetical protein
VGEALRAAADAAAAAAEGPGTGRSGRSSEAAESARRLYQRVDPALDFSAIYQLYLEHRDEL